jgi:hypothetical protein
VFGLWTIGCDIRAWTHLSYKQFMLCSFWNWRFHADEAQIRDFAIIGVGFCSWMDMTMAWLLLLTSVIRMMYFHFPLHSLSHSRTFCMGPSYFCTILIHLDKTDGSFCSYCWFFFLPIAFLLLLLYSLDELHVYVLLEKRCVFGCSSIHNGCAEGFMWTIDW